MSVRLGEVPGGAQRAEAVHEAPECAHLGFVTEAGSPRSLAEHPLGRSMSGAIVFVGCVGMQTSGS
ncbi:hypothetical protein [Leucobacter luti]|uniref:hypothetical protein n=1 Tax=Leucobacter luti TaxID=340320 RepID=UPI00215D6C92|nr:hypothetical protein [Leucobacter luti]